MNPTLQRIRRVLEDLTKNILGTLNRCAGFIVIMHPRGTVSSPNGLHHTRASVWIEQEIAIAAFLTQVFGRNLRVVAYIHRDIALEGMRDKLHLNPIPFKTNDEVLGHLRQILPEWLKVKVGNSDHLETYRQLVYSIAIEILSKLQRKVYKHHALPGYLWNAKEQGWGRVFELLMKRTSTGGYEPFTEPSSFQSRDRGKMKAAARILELYLWASENNPDFQEILRWYDLPQGNEVRKALDDAELGESESKP